jgi:protein-L-isoaspartate(D-aspartate) O-methyltransferase
MSMDFAAARANMVESQIRTADVTDLALTDAIRVAPRESVLPPAKAHAAYADIVVEYAPGRFLLKPRDVAKLLQALHPRSGERALAICAPYAAQVLEIMGLAVTRQDDPAAAVTGGPYDVVICEGAVAKAPAAWTGALAPGGRLGVVECSGPVGRAMLYVATDGEVGSRSLFDATAPVMDGFALEAGFAF